MHFADRLDDAIQSKGNPICVGLDPRFDQLPRQIRDAAIHAHGMTARAVAEAFLSFNRAILDAIADVVPVCKPQIAFYEEFGWEGLRAYTATVEYARQKGLVVISDAKRGDIGATAQAYARAHLAVTRDAAKLSRNEFDQILGSADQNIGGFDADALTVNPYLGRETILPFLKVAAANDRGIFILVKTSNQGSGDLQDQPIAATVDGVPLYELVADMVNDLGKNHRGACGLSCVGAVVGATYPQQARRLRALMLDTFFLIPGYGVQGGTAQDAVAGFRSDGRGAIVNNSRGIIFAYQQSPFAESHGEKDFAGAARAATLKMAAELKTAIS
ncbi:MAG: orotidine-5'-phosphate decarboxylase [Planctomycetota bacterium]